MNFISTEHACGADDVGPGGMGVAGAVKEKTIIHDLKLTDDGWATGADPPENVRRSSYIIIVVIITAGVYIVCMR